MPVWSLLFIIVVVQLWDAIGSLCSMIVGIYKL
uniref:Uncharacterized protein n=2 Tax=unclassified Caudoviricetes TaxID=2788787 RepID=A0A8S5PJ57_9CAUD|nr:MAG TPA: hypothetical protein [Siphoviridae sp. ctOSJ35]DAE15999.1 MAG TPA: hypothetical protein [Siphoviridae sp. ctIOF8]DAM81053.1 MAG TPA: hypothetical protein [Caudoviricetes sp.]